MEINFTHSSKTDIRDELVNLVVNLNHSTSLGLFDESIKELILFLSHNKLTKAEKQFYPQLNIEFLNSLNSYFHELHEFQDTTITKTPITINFNNIEEQYFYIWLNIYKANNKEYVENSRPIPKTLEGLAGETLYPKLMHFGAPIVNRFLGFTCVSGLNNKPRKTPELMPRAAEFMEYALTVFENKLKQILDAEEFVSYPIAFYLGHYLELAKIYISLNNLDMANATLDRLQNLTIPTPIDIAEQAKKIKDKIAKKIK